MIAQVIVGDAYPGANDTYDYIVPNEDTVQPGSRVVIPFGRKKTWGVVVGTSESTQIAATKLRPLLRVLDSGPALSADDLAVVAYLADTYRVSMSGALRHVLPSALRSQRPMRPTSTYVVSRLNGAALSAAMASLCKKDGTVRYAAQMEVLQRLQDNPAGLRMSELPQSTVKTLLRKNFVETIAREEVVAASTYVSSSTSLHPVVLAQQQERALDAILHSGSKNFLLHGAKGSGKTEVYIRIIRETLAKGRGAIVLVPEIALTPQIFEYMQESLQTRVALFHSKLTEAERFEQWMLVRTGAAPVVLGPRSAVFAPVENLGVIIIDEEHESSYKSERFPAYSAHEIAQFRVQRNDALLVLGSATPSIETYQDAMDGACTLVTMPDRLFGSKLPAVEIIDMREEVRRGNPEIISERLDDAIRDALDTGRQAMILLNRRGYSSFLMCTECGEAIDCDQCDVSMTYHKSEGMLKCHYCGRRAPIPAQCPHCGGRHLRRIGVGTQQLEEYLHATYPSARLLRMDADTMIGRTAHREAYEKVRNGEVDILIGTQMIAKGFDFERVSVAAVLAVDGMLHHPDFRSAERTFAQLTQLAGRAGRRGGAGQVYLQTYSPDHYAVQYAAHHDYTGFFRAESAYRRGLSLPPYGQYIVVRFQSPREQLAQHAAKDFLGRLSSGLVPYQDFIIRARASQSPLGRLDGIYRYQILLHLREKNTQVEDQLYQLLKTVTYDEVLVGIDVQPVDLS